MKKKSLLTTILLILIVVFTFSFTGCDKEVGTLETLKNEYGIVVDGGSFEEGSTLVSNEIEVTTEEAAEALTAIADQNYNKDGSVYIFDIYVMKDGAKVQPNGKVKVSIPMPNVQVNNYLVFHVKADNTVENLVPTVADGIISFETSSFSCFVIAEAAPAEHVHSFGGWYPSEETEDKHERACNCGEKETADCTFDEGVITQEPTHFEEGVKTYTCTECGRTKEEVVAKTTGHSFGDWAPDQTTETKHIRQCKCGEKETGDCAFDNGVVTQEPTHFEEGVKTYTCTKCGRTKEEAIGKTNEHNYEWVEGKASTCTEEGIVAHYHCEGCGKNFNENYNEIVSVALPIGSHEYGSMYWGKSANFWEDGNIEYYQCSECDKYFDEEYNEVETVAIPKYSTNLSICVNGTLTALTLDEQNDSFIQWSLAELSVVKGDVITLCQTDNAEISHNYFADGNVGTDGKILTTAAAANVSLHATPNGLMLFIDGYKYEGIVIEINGVQYPMIYTAYPDETMTYIYGYVNFTVGDKFVIVDNVSGTVYDYDDLDEGYLWNIWDFHRGDNGEFVIDYACRYGIEFDDGGNKKIYIDKVFAPLDGCSYELAFENTDSVAFEQIEIPENSEGYEDFMWYMAHEDVVNNEDIVSYINEKGLYVYIVKLQLEEGIKFNIKNLTANSMVNAEHLLELYVESGSITKDGDYIKVLKNGYYSIAYIPCGNGFMIEEAEQPADVYMYFDGEFVPLMKDAEGIVTYEGLAADTNTNIIFMDNTYTNYLPITLDSQTNTSITHVFEYNGMSMLYFDKAGTYNLAYNVETGVLSIVSVGGDDIGGGGSEEVPSVNYLYYLSVSGGSGGTQTLTMQVNPTNAKEFCYKGVELTASCFIGVIEMAKDASSNNTYGAIADTDSSIAQSYGTVAMVKIAGMYDVYFDTVAKTIKLVPVSGGSCADGACVYDEGVVTKEPTHLEEGVKTYTCTVCGRTKTDSIEKTPGHSFGDWVPDQTTEAKHIRQCKCGEKETGDCAFDNGVVTQEPTHFEEGVKTYTCTVCGRTKTDSIEKTPGHSFGDWTPDELDETKHYKQCACGEVETADCTFENGACIVCGREKSEEVDGIMIVISGGAATFVGKETVTSNSKLYGEKATVYIAQENDVLNVTLNDQAGRTFKHWASATGTIIPDEDFSILVFRNGYYYPVFEDTDMNAFSNRVKIYEGNCEEGILYMSTNSKGDIKYELEFVNYGRHDFYEYVNYNDQYHKQECLICGEDIFELHTEYSSEVEKEAGHTEEGLMRYECFCGHVWTEAIPVTDEHTIDYDDWHIVEESKNGQYGKYRVYCKYCDYYEEYWYLGGLNFVSFLDGKMINYQYTYGGKVSHDEYYYSYRNAEDKKVYIWALQYEYETSSNKDYNDTYIFMYVDDEDSTTIEPVYLSKSRGDRRAEYLWAIYAYAYDVNDWIEVLDSPDLNIGCGDGMLLGNSMSARSSVFESYHDYWAETYNKLRIPTSKAYNDLSDTPWEIEFEGKAFQGGYYDENDEYVMTGGRDVISFVKDAGTSYKKYMHVDKATGMTYGYEDYGTYYRTVFIMRTYKTIVSPEEFEKLDAAGQSVVYSYGDIEKDIKSLCSKRTLFNNFTLTVPETINAFRLIFSDPIGCVEISGDNTNVYYNTAQVYNSGSPITFTWNGEEDIVFDRYEIWDFAKQEWVLLSEEANYTFNTLENPCRTAAYIRVICHEIDVPVEPGETYRISVENGYFEIDGEEYTGTVEVPANTLVYVYANEVVGKTFEYWLDGNGEEFYEYSFNVTSNMTLIPVYEDAIYRVYCQGWNYDSYVSANDGEMHYTTEIEGKAGDTFELNTTYNPEYGCTVFIGWYLETYGPNGCEYVFISDSQTFTYEITGNEQGSLYAVWTTGENPFIKKYVDIRVVNGFVSYAGGEGGDIEGGATDNAYSSISLSNMGRVTFFDDPTDETVYTAWDIAYRYELEGEVMHDISESFEDEYDYYPADYWIDDPQYSYPDGVINVTGTETSNGDLEEGGEVVLSE